MDIHWRNTQKQTRFFFLDARCFLSILLFLIHARPWTLVLVLFVMLLFWFVERQGLSFGAALRAFRCWLIGNKRPANRRIARRYMIDFG